MIKRVLTHGVDAITTEPSATEHRAADLLRNLPAWGTVANDDYGRRVIITAPDAQRHLETHRDESLQSTQIRRVFTKIEEWAADSPREVTTAKRNQTRRLKVSLTLDE